MRNSLLLLLFFSFGIFAQAQVQIINNSNQSNKPAETPIRTLQDNGLEGIQVNYQFSQLYSFEKNHDNETYQMLNVLDFSHLQEVGLPALPTHIDLVAIPDGADYQLIINKTKSKTYQTKPIYPALKPAVDTEGAPEPSFEINQEFYNSDQIYPLQSVQIIGEMKFRGIRMAMVQICPVQYNPAKGKIFVHENISYEITFSGAEQFTNYANHTENYLNQLLNYPLNASSWQKESEKYYAQDKGASQTTNDSKNYIIITHSNYLAAADSIANWKRQMGYTVEIVSGNSWTAASVKTAVHSRYNNWTPKPDYLLIIGDHQDVPAEIHLSGSYSEPFGTDLYYVCMDGSNDFVPDMAKGRISAVTAASAMLQVQKIIKYERNPISDTSFYQNGLNCAQYQDDDNNGYADRRFTHTSEDIRDYLISKGYNSQRIYYTDNSVYPVNYNQGYYSNGQAIPSVLSKSNNFNWSGGAADITNSINAGKFLVFHRDHGYTGGSGWAHPYYVNSSISGLNNGDKLPIVFSINCHTGEFTQNSCFAETFMRKANAGTVGIIAASYYSYSGYNDGLSVGLVDAIWSNPGLVPVFGNGGVSSPNVTPHTDITTLGDVVNHGLVRMVQTWNGGNNANRYSYELFHYFGDPAMRIWTSLPENITALTADTVSCSDTAFVITNCSDSNAVATIIGNGVLLGKTTLVNGNGAIMLNGLQGAYLTLTISGHNKRPFIKHIVIGAGSNLTIYNSITENICFENNIGSLEVFPSCGNPPYQILWSNGDTVQKIENLASGTYSVIITDASNAIIYDTLFVDGPLTPIQLTSNITDAKCYFQSSGSIDINVIGGAAPYSYVWSNGGTSTISNNVSAGVHTINVTDSFGCIYTDSFIVHQPSPLDLTTSYTDDLANNCTGTATATPSGGISPYTYLWNDPTNQTTAMAINLCKGLYKVTLKDSNECLIYRTIYISNSVGIDENDESNMINIYPNPSQNGIFTVEFNNYQTEAYQLQIFNSTGKLLINKSLDANPMHSELVNINEFASGIYFLQLRDGADNLSVFKLIFE